MAFAGDAGGQSLEHPPRHLPPSLLGCPQQTGAGEETVNSGAVNLTGTLMSQKTCATAELGAAKL